MILPGAPIHGEFASADASALSEAAARFTLYGGGSTAAITLGTNDWVQVSHISIGSAGTNLVVTVYDGADNAGGAGELIWKGIVPTNSSIDVKISERHFCQKGTYPKVGTSAAGQVYVQIHGSIYRHNSVS